MPSKSFRALKGRHKRGPDNGSLIRYAAPSGLDFFSVDDPGGKRLCAPPLNPMPSKSFRALKGRHKRGPDNGSLIRYAAPSGLDFFSVDDPGAARKAACPWLPYAAPSVLFTEATIADRVAIRVRCSRC